MNWFNLGGQRSRSQWPHISHFLPCEGDISGTPSRNPGTYIHSESSINSLYFGSQRLKVKVTVASQSMFTQRRTDYILVVKGQGYMALRCFELNVSGMSKRNCITSGTNIPLEPRMTWKEYGGQMSKVKVTVTSQSKCFALLMQYLWNTSKEFFHIW